MLGKIIAKLFGSRNERIIKQLSKTVKKINALEESMIALDDAALRAKTDEFRKRLTEGETLDDVLPEAFAVVREAAKRVLGLRHYDVQLIGGMVLHQGKIAEMRTGEGKTLVATLAVYLNALSGEGVHVVTVNDYLAKRDGGELGKLYSFLGLTTGIIVSGMDTEEKKAAYRADITYGTNSEFGFDYLRTNMALSPDQRLQRKLNFAIVDEVDSILIDEARTPLIISGPAEMNTELYRKLNELVPYLTLQKKDPNQEKRSLLNDEEEIETGDFSIDEKTKQVGLTEMGHAHIEKLLVEKGLIAENESLYEPKNIGLFHHLNACLRAHHLYHRDVDYIVKDGQVMIVDEFTGRTLAGRRWSDGLHQAIEIKEGVTVQQESQTLASITYQNFFRMYEKLSGMTGTADTEAYEFQDIYNLETVVIPTNRPIARIDYTDMIFLKQSGKYQAIVAEVKECLARRQPVLLGTASIETSELISDLLTKEGVAHNVLNAKQHAREAEIVANAGLPGQITIATNMAGRGTDIVLGGSLKAELDKLGADATEEEKAAVQEAWQKRHDEVIAAGGLHVIGAERHESRRIDNQLRGRSGRQGDPGSSRFYVALDDNLVRIFAGDRMAGMMERLGMGENDVIESKMVSRQIEGAQRKVEAHNFDARKHLLEYDDVANEQRKVIYNQRSVIMDAENIREMLDEMRESIVTRLITHYAPADQVRQNWDVAGLEAALLNEFGLSIAVEKEWLAKEPDLSVDEIQKRLLAAFNAIDAQKRAQYGDDMMDWAGKYVALQIIDELWKGHLATMDMLRQAIWLRSRAQKDPKREYQREAYELFIDLLANIQLQIVRLLNHITFNAPNAESTATAAEPAPEASQSQSTNDATASQNPPITEVEASKVGRNQPCPCGSGKKYKHCCGKL